MLSAPIRQLLASLVALALVAPASAHASGSRAGATRAATRDAIAHLERVGVTLSARELQVHCSARGRSRWLCFVYATSGQCAGTGAVPKSGGIERAGVASALT
jgi:hypothetical protein